MSIRKLLFHLFFVFLLMGFKMGVANAQETIDTVQYEMKDTVLARKCIISAKEFLAAGDYDSALIVASKAYTIYKNLSWGKDTILADATFVLARVCDEKNDFDQAINLYQNSLDIYNESFGGINTKVADCYNNMGLLENTRGNYEKSIFFLKKALEIKNKIFGTDSFESAIGLANLGIPYKEIGEYNDALIYYNRSLSILKQTLGSDDLKTGFLFNNIGNLYRIKGDYKKAISSYESSLVILDKKLGGQHPTVAFPYNNIGIVYSILGNNYKAIEFYKKALNIRINALGGAHPEVGKTYINLGVEMSNLGDHEIAMEYYYKALDILAPKVGDTSPIVAHVYENIGVEYRDLKKFDDALSSFEKVLKIRKENFSEGNYDIANTMYNIGRIYNDLKQYEKALEYLTESKNIIENSFGLKHSFNAIIGIQLIQLKIENGELDQAKKELLSAYRALNYDLSKERDFSNVIDKKVLLKTFLKGLEINNFENGNQISTSNSISDFLKINELLEELNKGYGEDHHSLELNNISLLLCEKALGDLTGMKRGGHLPESFYFIEKNRSQQLLFAINEVDALSFSGIPENLLTVEYEIRTDLTWREKQYYQKLSEGLEETDTTVLAISSKLFDLNREFEALKERFEKDYPDYYKLKYDLSTVSLEYVQDTLLTADQTLLEYFVGDSSIFIFIVGKEQYDVVEVKRDFPLEDWVKQLQHGLTGYYTQPLAQRNDDLYKTTVKQYMEASQQLYGKLIAPVKEKLNTSELIIVPDGLLGYVPFGALLSGQPKRASIFDTYPFLEKEYKISYCYSATLLREMKEKRHKRHTTGSLVAFAPFYEGSYAKLDSTLSLAFDTLANGQDTLIFNDVVTRKDFNNLPASGEEVKAASLFWDGDYYLNSDATEDRFNEVAGDYRIVHLSTHGVADSRSGDYSYLAFAEQKDSIENELLYVRDLYNIQLNADLVTLSACETAAGELQRGEGIISLARAFAYAGAKSIVTTLWVADDTATKDLMKVFYQQLKKGDTKDTALQKAKLKLLDDRRHAHPFFWAGFVPVGDMEVLD